MGIYSVQGAGPAYGYYPAAPSAPMAPPPPPPVAPPAAPAPMAPGPVTPPPPAWPMPPASGPTAPAPGPTPVQGPWTPPGVGPTAALDLAKILAHPIQTIKSLFVLTKDVLALQPKRGLSVASAGPAMAQYAEARKHLEEAPFRKIFPFFERAMDKWAFARFQELAPEVQGRLSQRAWHPIQLEWPDGGSGHDCLTELMMLSDVANSASDGQVVKALMGANRLQFKNSSAMDYFYPLARAGDALILRRNLPIVPGQKPLKETLAAYMNQQVQVHIQI